MDERERNEYRKIYAELCSLIVFAAAASIVIKIAVLKIPPQDIYFEFLIAIGAPLYLFIRQLMLGLDPYAAEKPIRKRKQFVVSLLAALAGMAVVRFGQDTASEESIIANLAIFIVFYTAAYFLIRLITRKNSESKAKKYEED